MTIEERNKIIDEIHESVYSAYDDPDDCLSYLDGAWEYYVEKYNIPEEEQDYIFENI